MPDTIRTRSPADRTRHTKERKKRQLDRLRHQAAEAAWLRAQVRSICHELTSLDGPTVPKGPILDRLLALIGLQGRQ